MNRILLLLVIWLPLLSCSNDDTDPDQTGKFVGSWKSDPQDIGPYISVDTWEIDKIAENKVRVIIKNEWKSKDPKNTPDDSGSTVLDDVLINSDGIMILDYRETIDRETYEAKGKGIIKGDKLSISLVGTNLSDGSSESYIMDLTRVVK